MSFRLRDMYFPYHETTIYTEEELRQSLRRILQKTPGRAIRLISPEGDILDVALDKKYGSIHFTNRTMLPPYLVVVNPTNPRDIDHEFDVGGTPTPISLRHCINPQKAIEIAVYFFRHGTIPDDVPWEEV